MDDLRRPVGTRPNRFMDQFRLFIRTRHLAYRTEKTYCYWVLFFIRYHQKKHPRLMGPREVEQFLAFLAEERHTSVNTQKTALNALVFLYDKFLKQPLGQLHFKKVTRPRRIPTVFTHQEAQKVIGELNGIPKLSAQLMYGAGMRVSEVCRLRVQDIDFQVNCIIVREAKGGRMRRTLLPKSLVAPLQTQLMKVTALHQQDLQDGFGSVYMPFALAKSTLRRNLSWVGNIYFRLESFQKIPDLKSLGVTTLVNAKYNERLNRPLEKVALLKAGAVILFATALQLGFSKAVLICAISKKFSGTKILQPLKSTLMWWACMSEE